MLTKSHAITVALLAGAFTSHPVGAQRLSAGPFALAAQHELLGEPLVGATLSLERVPRSGALAVRIGVERARGAANRIGVPCVGMVNPAENCQPVPMHDEAHLTAGSFGMTARLIGRTRGSVVLVGDVALAELRVDSRAPARDREFSASKLLWGPSVGAEARWSPSTRLPIEIEAGGSRGGLGPLVQSGVMDGYTPFERWFGVWRLQAGLAWRPRGRRREG